ncbi:hypothetical protein TTHERM_01193500 (macronuclear) [Tetrahymena thermophila SB210]|uniref:Uncharacterized protein n=1 Tax=Tetrahymena thermophila (strain SB210) TaxID=312017 RepID=Q22AM6_TETTS|nr:hypothetical protein TTHERM_01193500 [Tetrahymena thermophila SB210]EAR82330.2 hypothetical protein TTHERM_01193500 [Tetrahymena thermophila SB210]|eukprot:XP_001029993.2 hypothetical protein TTHERM_01193500 [Tetrahymena thermophila SB210]
MMKFNSQANEDFCASPHFFIAQGLKERGNSNLSKIRINNFKDQEQYFVKREKSFVLDCTNKLKLPKDYNSLYDKYMVNFLSKNSTLTDLKRAGIICKYQQDGNHLILFEHQQQQQRRNLNEFQDNVELLQKKRKKQQSLHNFQKLPEIPNIQEQREQNPLSNRSHKSSCEKLAQIKEQQSEKITNQSYEEKLHKLNESLSKEHKQKKVQSIIKISTKQKLNQINPNSYSKDSTQSSDQKQPNSKYISVSFRNRNQSSHQIGSYKIREQDQFNLKINPLYRKQINSTSQPRNLTHRINNSIENSPKSHAVNSFQQQNDSSLQQQIDSSQQLQINQSYLNLNNSSHHKNLSGQKNTQDFIKIYDNNTLPQSRYQLPNTTLKIQKFKLLSSFTNNKYSIPQPQIKTLVMQKKCNSSNISLNNINKEENSKQEEDVQALSKDEFQKMIQKYKQKIEKKLKINQDQNEENDQQVVQNQEQQSKIIEQDKLNKINDNLEEKSQINNETDNNKINIQ